MTNLERISLNRANLAYYQREKETVQESIRTALLNRDKEGVRNWSARLYWILGEIKRLEDILGVDA